MAKQAIEETLKKSLKEASDYKYALEESSIVAITDQKGIITYVNSNFCKISQFSSEELIGQNYQIVNSSFHSKKFIKNMWTTIASGKVWKGEIRNKAKDGSIYWVDTTIVPILDDDGKPIKYIAIQYNITERKKAEQKISNLTERLILATSSAKIGIWDWDIPANNLIWDLNMYEIFGIEIDKFSGAFEAWENTVHPDDLQKALKDVQQALDGTQNFNSSFRILWPNNIVKYIEGQAIVLRDQDGKAIRMIGVNRDITDRKEAEMEMLHLINNTEEAFILLNNQLKIVSFNNQFKNLYKKYLGLEIQKGRSIFDYAQLERKELVQSIYQKVLAGNIEESEINIPIQNAESKTFHIKYNPAKDELGKVIGVFVTASDITEKKKEEEQKEFDRRDKEALINSTDDLIWSISKDLKLIAANNSFIKEISKFSGVEIKQGDEVLRADIYPADFVSFWSELYHRALQGETIKIEIQSPTMDDGIQKWFETSFNPIYIKEQIVGIACYSRNITERKTSEILLRKNEARLAEAQSLAKIGNWETDLSTLDVIWSEQTYRIFDCKPSDFKSTHPDFLRFVHPHDVERVDSAFKNSFNMKSINTIEHRVITKSGELKFVEERWQIIHDKNDIPLRAVGTCQDITERKKSEHENKFKAELLATIGQAVISTDLSGNITFWNKAAVDLYGWAIEEAIGMNILDITPTNQTKAEAMMIMRKLSKGEHWSGEFYVKRKDGTSFPIYVSNSPVFDEFGNLTGIIGVSNDITERKESELERTKITNDLIQRNRDLEQFTFIISHNLRAPTANIIGFADILLNQTLTPLEQKEFLHGLSKSVSGLDSIIKDINSILQVKREVNEKKELLSFTKLVKDISASIENIIEKHNVSILTDFTEVDEIFSLKAYMHSIFYNLISNSIKYSKPDEAPFIEIKSKNKNGVIILTFKDNGLGIDLKSKGDKVFGLYNRFHAHVEGKGMGLFMVKTQVEAIGGKITISSSLNEGTTFTIVFK